MVPGCPLSSPLLTIMWAILWYRVFLCFGPRHSFVLALQVLLSAPTPILRLSASCLSRLWVLKRVHGMDVEKGKGMHASLE